MSRVFEKGLNFPGKDAIRIPHSLLLLFFFFYFLFLFGVLYLHFLSFLHFVKYDS